MTCRWLTVTQMAEYMQVTERTVYRWVKDDKVVFIKLGRVVRVCPQLPDDTRREEPDGNNLP